jgi:2'-5' RNA ligase
MRIFIGIDMDQNIRDGIARYVEGVRGFAPDARWVKPETFHVTLKFIGETSPETVEQMKAALTTPKVAPFPISFRGSGFFPNPRSARVFWIGVHADERLPELARQVDEATATLGFQREEQGFRPHLTLARAGARSSGNPHQKAHGAAPQLRRLQEKLAARAEPDFGTMTARDFFLYESKLLRGGAQYTKIARFPLE